MKILLTGAAGFIGHHVASRLLQRGDTVFGIDNFNNYYAPQWKFENSVQFDRHQNGQMLAVDLRDYDKVSQLMIKQRFDAVIHLAAMAGVRSSVLHPGLYMQVNLTASQNLIELARLHGVDNFVFASTSSVYGHTKRIPFDEDDACGLPLHPYAASKRAVEQIGSTYHRNYGINFTALRLFTVYGPAGRPDMMPYLLARSIATGESVPRFRGNFQRDWTFVDDIANGIVSAVDKPLGFEIINLGRGEPVSLDKFIGTLQRVARGQANLDVIAAPSTEMLVTFACNEKARALLGFDPQISIDQGVELFWNWFSKNRAQNLVENAA
jgi:UDP-glucuronate 4-epimerase